MPDRRFYNKGFITATNYLSIQAPKGPSFQVFISDFDGNANFDPALLFSFGAKSDQIPASPIMSLRLRVLEKRWISSNRSSYFVPIETCHSW